MRTTKSIIRTSSWVASVTWTVRIVVFTLSLPFPLSIKNSSFVYTAKLSGSVRIFPWRYTIAILIS
jgi:hypothetical protein